MRVVTSSPFWVGERQRSDGDREPSLIVSLAGHAWIVEEDCYLPLLITAVQETLRGKALCPSLAATTDEAWRFPLPIPAGLFEAVTKPLVELRSSQAERLSSRNAWDPRPIRQL